MCLDRCNIAQIIALEKDLSLFVLIDVVSIRIAKSAMSADGMIKLSFK
jgi:hypothetical protein